VKPKHFHLVNSNHNPVARVPVHADAAILLHNPKDSRKINGWRIDTHNVIAVSAPGSTREQVKTEIETMLPAAHLDGIRIVNLEGERSW